MKDLAKNFAKFLQDFQGFDHDLAKISEIFAKILEDPRLMRIFLKIL